MKIRAFIDRSWFYLKRYRMSKGYGVHSPFAFHLITTIIRETYPYYAYSSLRKIRNQIRRNHKEFSSFNSIKNDELLFRLVNYLQPATIVELGTQSGLSTLYLASVNRKTPCFTFDENSPLNELAQSLFADFQDNIHFVVGDIKEKFTEWLEKENQLEFVVFNRKQVDKEIWHRCIQKKTKDSLFIIQGIYQDEEMQSLWQEIVEDQRVGITFDLYEVGLVFFDTSRVKQHYSINF